MPADKHIPVALSPYRAGVCWHGLKRKEHGGPERFCGEHGELCEVSRPTEKIEEIFGHFIKPEYKWGAASSARIQVFLCRKHRAALREKGYIVVKVTSVMPD